MGEIVKTFGRSFLVSCFLPAGALIAANIVFWLTLSSKPVMAFLQTIESARGVTLLVCTFVVGLAISVLQNPLIRLFEGYERRLFRSAAAVFAALILPTYWWSRVSGAWMIPAVLAVLSVAVWVSHLIGASWQRRRFREEKLKTDVNAKYEFFRNYPMEEQYVLATKLGNRIRAFESHAAVYHIDPITTWYRLLAVIPSDFQEQIGTAEANFDAVINLAAVAFLLALEALGIYLVHGHGGWLTTALILAATGYALYQVACNYAVGPWGESVRSAFDLYRLDLLRQLGLYSPVKVHTLKDEQDLWYSIQQLTIYGREDPEYPVRFTLTRPRGPEEQPDETK